MKGYVVGAETQALRDRREGLRVAWFATAGSFAADVTRTIATR